MDSEKTVPLGPLRRAASLLVALAFHLTACDRTPETKPETKLPTQNAGRPSAEPAATTPAAAGSATSHASFRLPSRSRLVAIGDIHGDLTALRAALRLAGAIDSDD